MPTNSYALCIDCHALKLTQEDEENIARWIMIFMAMFDDNNCNSV